MVSIPAAVVSIRLDLPPPQRPDHLVKPPVFISIMGRDIIYIGPNKSSPATLIADVTAALNSKDPYSERILVRGDKDIEYGDFVKVLNELQQNGFHQVGLVNEDIE
jgi:biopolymer transport protein ExbD